MKTYIELYKESKQTGLLPHDGNYRLRANGLCNVVVDGRLLGDHRLFKLFIPDNTSLGYWGFGGKSDTLDGYTFTPLRETIVLFMAAMNNEL